MSERPIKIRIRDLHKRFGAKQVLDGIDRLAAAAGTIGYEVLTRLGSRFARRYIRPAAKKADP